MSTSRLDDDAVARALERLDGWTLDGGKLFRRFTFADFRGAWGFMAQVALIAEAHNHHPEWSNVYNRVDIHLTTHDAGGITDFDVAFATAVNELGARASA
ncbi:MAG: 4a-hydroxytetrahydrobiopterin dehydratase [Acidobacteriota bacterium]